MFRIVITALMVTAALAFSVSISVSQSENVSYSTVWERFATFDAGSEVQIDHQPLNAFLGQTVLPLGRSKSKLGTQAKQEYFIGSKIRSTTSGSPSKYESNRVFFHAFTDEHTTFLKAYQQGLENLSNRRPLRELTKNEQLAFWLNLYNVTVMAKVADEYPIQKLKAFRESDRGTPFWQEKAVSVEGVPLSLVDIEQILFNNWEDPRVMYGLYQGSIGGPSLPNEAFTGENVWELLNDNAIEFVNSNRGVRTKGRESADVSKMYQWAAAAFGYSDEAIISHILIYADDFHGDLTYLSSIKPKYYDWNITDLLGGMLHEGQQTQLGGVLTAGGNQQTTPGFNSPSFHNTGGELTLNKADIGGVFNTLSDKATTELSTILPPRALKFLLDVKVHNDIPDQTPVVTVLDCSLEDCPEAGEVPDQP